MGFAVRFKGNQKPVTTTGIAGASGTVVTGLPIDMGVLQPGTLSALVTLTVQTSTVTLTPSWQVSNDGTTWYAVQGSAGTVRTGTGSTVTTSEVLSLKDTIVWKFARLAVTVGVTTAVVSAEFYACSYSYVNPQFQ